MPTRSGRIPVLPLLTAAVVVLAACSLSGLAAASSGPAEERVRALLFPEANVEALRALGPEVLPVLARIYEASSADERAVIAWVFYSLGLQSPEAKRVLMGDLHTTHENLRLQAQWALGRVSSDRDVVDALLDNMQNDANPLFRDKAACALAHDQIHLTEEQKVHLYDRLIRALGDRKEQVRSIAIKALEIHTGQSKGFRPNAPIEEREKQVRVWESWLAEYRAQL